MQDELAEVEGISTAMLVTLGENGIKTVEDLADCATDELSGWQERAHGQTKQHPGILQSFDLSKQDIEQIILNARVKAGWIEPLPAEEAADEAAEEAQDSALDPGEGGHDADREEKAL